MDEEEPIEEFQRIFKKRAEGQLSGSFEIIVDGFLSS